MAGKPKGYDPTKVKVYAGAVLMKDFGEDTFIKVSRTVPMRSQKVGADGNLTINRSANNTGMMEITIMNNSASNAVLKTLALLDEGFPIAIVDLNFAGDLGASSIYAWVENTPDFERAAEVGECTWPIIVADVDLVFAALDSAI
ncbi:MAG: phage structural protein [Paraclostridium sp.]